MLDLATHNLLVELMIEGRNPHAGDALSKDEAQALRKGLKADEPVRALLRGIVPRGGQTVWALTSDRVVMARPGWKYQPSALAVSAIRSVDVARGRFGATIGLSSAEGRSCVYGADLTLAMVFAQAVCAQSGASLSTWKADAPSADGTQHAQTLARDAEALLAAA